MRLKFFPHREIRYFIFTVWGTLFRTRVHSHSTKISDKILGNAVLSPYSLVLWKKVTTGYLLNLRNMNRKSILLNSYFEVLLICFCDNFNVKIIRALFLLVVFQYSPSSCV
jgi:hypothetical protein